MDQTLLHSTKTTLTQMDMHFIQADDGETVIVPLGLTNADLVLVHIQLDEERREVLIGSQLCGVPSSRRAHVATLLSELNHRIKFVTFSLGGDGAHADSCLDFSFVTDPESALERAMARFICVIAEYREPIVKRASKRAPRRSRVEREVADLLRELD